MTTATEFREQNALLDDPRALRQQMATDGFLFFAAWCLRMRSWSCDARSCRSATTTAG